MRKKRTSWNKGFRNRIPNPYIFCACGCGQKRKKYDKYGIERKYIPSHKNRRKGVVVKCAWCGQEKKIIPSKVKNRKNHFCNLKCRVEWQKENSKGKNNLNWRGGEKKAKCAFCENMLYMNKYRLKRSHHHFCNQTCKGKWWTKNKVGKRNPNWKQQTVFCSHCGKKKMLSPCLIKSHNFCNFSCKGKWQALQLIGKNNPNFLGGKSFEPYGIEFNEALKEKIRNRDGNKCQKCGASGKEFIRKLPIHHIDYDKKNNREENLITLCKYCNSEVNFDREFWKIFFQELRREKLEGLKELENVHQKNK